MTIHEAVSGFNAEMKEWDAQYQCTLRFVVHMGSVGEQVALTRFMRNSSTALFA